MFLLFLATNEVFTRRSEILKVLDELPWQAHRDSFTITIYPSYHPDWYLSMSHRNDPPKHRLYKSTRYYTHLPSAVVVPRDAPPSLLSATVDIHMIFPYGEENVIIPFHTWQILCLYEKPSYDWNDLAALAERLGVETHTLGSYVPPRLPGQRSSALLA